MGLFTDVVSLITNYAHTFKIPEKFENNSYGQTQIL